MKGNFWKGEEEVGTRRGIVVVVQIEVRIKEANVPIFVCYSLLWLVGAWQ
jgi:hypothetical protein